MKIPFTKAHGARNDFLLTWREEAVVSDFPAMARAICDRGARDAKRGGGLGDGQA
jgi:diaminopimelate epimerase